MLTLRDVIIYEGLTQKSFADFKGDDEEDVLTLMYACDREEQRKYPLNIYLRASRNTSERAVFVRMISEDIVFVNQFVRTDMTPQIKHKGKKIKTKTFTDSIMYMIYRGKLDAEWLLGQGLEMLQPLVHGMEEYIHQEMSDIKFWNLLKMSPHLQKKDNDRLRRVFQYAWEKSEMDSKIDDMEIGDAVFAMWGTVTLGPPGDAGGTVAAETPGDAGGTVAAETPGEAGGTVAAETPGEAGGTGAEATLPSSDERDEG